MYNSQVFNDAIAALTSRIAVFFPELHQHLIEIPTHGGSGMGNYISIMGLKDYYESLNLLIKYNTKTTN